jgi:hypothetical protein
MFTGYNELSAKIVNMTDEFVNIMSNRGLEVGQGVKLQFRDKINLGGTDQHSSLISAEFRCSGKVLLQDGYLIELRFIRSIYGSYEEYVKNKLIEQFIKTLS